MHSHSDIKVFLLQKSLPLYRKELFNRLCELYGIDVVASGFVEVGMRSKKSAYRIETVELLAGRVFYFKGLYRLLRMSEVDKIIVTPTPRNLSLWWLKIWAKIEKVELHGYSMGPMPNKSLFESIVHTLFTKALIHDYVSIITYNSAGYIYYRNIGFKGALEIGHNAAFSLFDTSKLRKIYFQNKLQLIGSSATRHFVFVGRLIEGKGISELIKVVQGTNNCTLHIVGDGPLKEWLPKGINIVYHGAKDPFWIKENLIECIALIQPGLGGLSLQLANELGMATIYNNGDGSEFDRGLDGYSGIRYSNNEELHNVLENSDLSSFMEASYDIGSKLNLDYLADKFKVIYE